MNSSITFSNEFSEEEIYGFEAEQIEKSLDLENDWVSYDPKLYEVDNFLQNPTIGFKPIEGINVEYFDQNEKTKKEKVENENENVKESENENEKDQVNENEKDRSKNTRFNFNFEKYLDREQNNEFQNLDLESDFWFDGYNHEKDQKKYTVKEEEEEEEKNKKKRKEKEKKSR